MTYANNDGEQAVGRHPPNLRDHHGRHGPLHLLRRPGIAPVNDTLAHLSLGHEVREGRLRLGRAAEEPAVGLLDGRAPGLGDALDGGEDVLFELALVGPGPCQ